MVPSNFEIAVTLVIANEGGYVNNLSDPGGETKYGISKRSYPDVDIKNLSVDEAKNIYRRDFWKFDGVIDPQTSTKLMDMTVNMGLGTATRLVQMALCELDKTVVIDGKWGPNTVARINQCLPSEILPEIRTEQSHYYTKLVAQKPEMMVLLRGWLKRVQSC